MSQEDGVVDNGSGSVVRADINAQLGAIFTSHSGATEPGSPFAYQMWADTANDIMKIRNAANSANIAVFKLSTGGMIQGADIASATALPVLADGNFNDVTGTTSITSINSLGVGSIKWLRFDGALSIAHHATNLVLPNGQQIITVAGDILCFYEYAAGDWRLISNTSDSLPYRKGSDIASASALAIATGGAYDITGSTTITSINTIGVGTILLLKFDDALTVAHDATNLILPGATDISVSPGDILVFHEYNSGNWRLVSNSASSGVSGDIEAVSLTLTGTTETDTNTIVKGNIVKAWVNWAGAGSIVDSFNVTSITDNGTGDYTITWNTDFANATYALSGMALEDTGPQSRIVSVKNGTTLAAGTVNVQIRDTGGNAEDATIITVIAIGDQ